MDFTDIESTTWPLQSGKTSKSQSIDLRPKFMTRARLDDRILYRSLQAAWLEKLSVKDLDLITDMLANLAENRADKYYLLVAKMLTVVFRNEKSADQIIQMLPTMMRGALIYVLDRNSWRGEKTEIFIEYPETGEEDRMSCWNQRLQLYRGIEEGISKLSLEYDKDLASGSQPLPDLGDLSSPRNIKYRKDIWAMVQQQGDEAFVDYFDRWRALAANMFQMTQLPREEITFLYPIVKEYSTRLKLHCQKLESSIEKMDQEAQHIQETERKQQQTIELLKKEITASKEVFHNCVLYLQRLSSRFGAGFNSQTQVAITRQERIPVSLKGSEEEETRGDEKGIPRLEVPQLFKNMQSIVFGVEGMFERYESQIESQQDHLKTTVASLSIAEENVNQLRHKSAGDAARIETLTKELQLREEDVNKVTERLIQSQNIISDMEDRLAANCRRRRSGAERYTPPVDPQQRSCYLTQKENTDGDNNENQCKTQILVNSKKEIRELKEEIAGKDTVIQKLASNLCSLRETYEKEILEHGSVRTERDTLMSRLYQVQEATERQSEEPITSRGKQSELVGWIESLARRCRASEKLLKTLQYQQVNLADEYKQTVEDKDRQIGDLRRELVEHLTVKEERDKLNLILHQLKEVVSPHAEGKLSFENGYTHLISWVRKQKEEHNAARECLSTCLIKMNSKDIEGLGQQVQEATEMITEKRPAIQTSLNNDECNTEKPMPYPAAGGQGNITKCMDENKIPDSCNSAITPTNQIGKVLSFFFDRYNREIEATQIKNEQLHKQLGNIDGRLDSYIHVLKCKPVADSTSFDKTQGVNDSQGDITGKLDLLVKWMSERLRESCPDKSQREAEVVQRTRNKQTTSIVSNRTTDKTPPLPQTIEARNIQAPMTDQRNLSDVEGPRVPPKIAVAVNPGRTLRSQTRRQGKSSGGKGSIDGTGVIRVKFRPSAKKK